MSGAKGKKGASQAHKQNARPFVCGVCEGFYGKPWSQRQRRELFCRMRRMRLNTYLYAPKDDYKHRLHWRQLYSDMEADELKSLIKAAKENNVDFVYALSPGLDIVYSDKEDVDAIKSKLKQVIKLGCASFALLFDDIDTDLCPEDLKTFKTLGLAQSAITNEIYKYLEDPAVFLFCPTEYCSSRAAPSLLHSAYLKDIGTELNPGIDILWTGNKVVSQRITAESIKDVTQCIKRPPLIWDNLHANDYDQTRLFLGPYEGRSPDLVGHLRGVLTNPNCEFEANFIAMHTLAQWSKNKVENYPPSNGLVGKASDKKSAKSENDVEKDKDSQGYQPKHSLMRAIQDWIPEMYEAKTHQDIEDKDVGSPSRSTRLATKSKANKGKEHGCKNSVKRKMEELEPLNVEDLALLCDLFYLPFEHGPRAIHLLKEAHWIISHASLVGSNAKLPKTEQPPEVREWYDRAIQFHEMYRNMTVMVDKFVNIPNRVLLYELYPYVGDMRSVLSMINGSVKWHGLGKPDKEPFRSGEQEPWVYRGGLHAEFRRILPIEGENDMFPPPQREPRSHNVYTIRPYFPDDKDAVYAVCRKTCDDGGDSSDIFPTYPDLVADESVGGFLAVSREYCYVVEDDADIVGYLVATPDARGYQKCWLETWIPQMKKKYPKSSNAENMSSAEDIIQTFHTPPKALPDSLIEKYPGFVHLNLLSRKLSDLTIPRQLLSCAIKTLRAKGTRGIHTLVHVNHINLLAFHIKLGFIDITDADAPEDMLVLGQLI